MYKVIKIEGKENKLEYTIEASLYEDCTQSVTDIMMDLTSNSEDRDIKGLMQTMSRVPQKAITVFYAGLLEYHGPEGDGTVTTFEEGKRLCIAYLKEEGCNWYDVLTMCLNQMGEDGFFKLVGLDTLFTTMTQPEAEAEAPKVTKVPQDRKKKEKVSENK